LKYLPDRQRVLVTSDLGVCWLNWNEEGTQRGL